MTTRTLRLTAPITAAAALLALTLGACSSAGTDDGDRAPATAGSSTLRYIGVGAPASAINDPHGGVLNQSDLVRFSLMYDVLAKPGPDGATELRLASSVTPDASLKRWTVSLRKATFTNGTPVRAQDVLFSMRRILSKSAENFGRMKMFDLDASMAKDDQTLVLVTTAAYAEVPRALESVTYVVPDGTKDFSTAPIGSGPYKLVSQASDVAVLERNEGWWGPKPATQRIEVRAMIDPQARARAVLAGQADVASSVSPTLARSAEGSSDVKVVRRKGIQSYPFVMRSDRAPFDDPDVRRAFKLAADRDALVDKAFLGLGSVGTDVLAPYDRSAPQPVPVHRDLAEARRLLAKAGHSKGLAVTLYTTSSYPGMDTAATLFAGQLKDIGVTATVKVSPPDSYWTKIYGQEAFYTGFFGGIPFLDMARVALLPDSPANETAWRNPRWSSDFAAALAIKDDVARSTALGDLQQQVASQGGYLVWGLGDGLDLARVKVEGLPTGPGFAPSFIDQVRVG